MINLSSLQFWFVQLFRFWGLFDHCVPLPLLQIWNNTDCFCQALSDPDGNSDK
jgi:hypothetical protein